MLPAGPAALPKGSEVVFFNIHAAAEVLGRVVRISKVENVSFLHVQGNPLDQQDIREKLNLARHAYISFFMILYSIYVIGVLFRLCKSSPAAWLANDAVDTESAALQLLHRHFLWSGDHVTSAESSLAPLFWPTC